MRRYSTMLLIELKLSFRSIDMFIFAICMPLVVMILLGIIYGNQPAFEGANYTLLQQSFGAVSSIAICAGGLMGLPLVISDYRHRKILKRFQVTPVSPLLILIVQMTIYTLYSLVSLATLFLTAYLFFDFRMIGSNLAFFFFFLFVMLSMFSIGLMVGGIAPNMKTANVLASVLYFPMLIFSGATLPYEIMPDNLQKISSILPLTHGIKLLKNVTLGIQLENVFHATVWLILTASICTVVSLKFFKWE